MATFEGLTRKQHEVFAQIATGNDRAHHSKTLQALQAKGFIVATPRKLPGWPPVTVNTYDVPIDVHIRWCAWCAENPECLVCGVSLKGQFDTEYCEACNAKRNETGEYIENAYLDVQPGESSSTFLMGV